MLRRNGHEVKVLTRCFSAIGYRLAKGEQDAFVNGRLLVISAFSAYMPRVTLVSLIKRNELVIAHSSERVSPFIFKGNPTEELLVKHNA